MNNNRAFLLLGAIFQPWQLIFPKTKEIASINKNESGEPPHLKSYGSHQCALHDTSMVNTVNNSCNNWRQIIVNSSYLYLRRRGSQSLIAQNSAPIDITGHPTFAQKHPPGPSGIRSRSEQVARLSTSNQVDPYDILVIGGGCTGVGIALDAVSRRGFGDTDPQLRVACIERGDFGSETSSRSTKLIWAGIRYLATATSSLLSMKLFTDPKQTIQNFFSEYQMVLHCHRERRYMTTKQPHLTNWIPILIPFNSWYVTPPPLGHPLFSFFPILAPLVLKFYDAMSGFTCPSSYCLSPSQAKKVFPQLRYQVASDKVAAEDGLNSQSSSKNDELLKYCAVFYEAQHNDARTNLAIALTAAQYGADIANYVEMIGVIQQPVEVEDQNVHVGASESQALALKTLANKRIIGIRAIDRMTKREFDIYAKNIIFAGGPFTDELRKMEHNNIYTPSTSSQKLAPIAIGDKSMEVNNVSLKSAVKSAAGTHVVLPGYYCSKNMGLLDYNTSDGRFLFILPWENHTLVGTTDVKRPAESLPRPREEEINWILSECGKYLSKDLTVRRSDVLSGWAGYRPLAVDPHLPPGAPISRDHVISVNPVTGVRFIAGGKWTTWREMAQDIVDRVVGNEGPKSKTLDIVLYGGGDGWSPNLAIQLLQRYDGMTEDIAENLAKTYGVRSWEVCELLPLKNLSDKNKISSRFPYIDAEVRFACKEYACTIEDILSRRTRLAFLNKESAMLAIPVVADIMANELGWSDLVKKEQVHAAQQYISTYAGRSPDSEN